MTKRNRGKDVKKRAVVGLLTLRWLRRRDSHRHGHGRG
jgi:hypothetical protein